MIPFQKPDFSDWPHSTRNEVNTALRAAVSAGEMLHQAFYSEYKTYTKKDKSEFTPFDEQAEVIAKSVINISEPNAIIMSEELFPCQDVCGMDFWTIDGIDGTTNFSRGIPVCNFTISKVIGGEIAVGVVFDFLHGELFFAVRNGGAYLNGKRIRVQNRKFSESVITFAPLLDVRSGKGKKENQSVAALWSGMKEISELSGRFHREFQSGGQELSWVASGKLDGYASSWTNPWDLSAGVLLVLEAGGIATNILGEIWRPSFWGVIAGSPCVHGEMLKIFQKNFYQ